MKSVFKLFGFIALVTVIVFSMTACDSGGDGGGGPVTSPLDGTWVDETREGTKLVIGNGSITVSNYDDHLSSPYIEIMKGTISTSGNNLSVTFSQVNSAMLGQDGLELGLTNNTWYTKGLMRTTIIQKMVSDGMTESAAEQKYNTDYAAKVDEQFGTETGTWTISGSTLTLVLVNQGTQVYTKNGSYTAPPWRWSAYDDSYNGGNSEITMTEDPEGTLTFNATIVDDANNPDDGYVGINVRPNAAKLTELKTATSITFDAYGDGNKYVFRLATSDITDWAYYQQEFTPANGEWETITIYISLLKQPNWNEMEVKDFTQSLVEEIQLQADWQVTEFEISIRNLTLGTETDPIAGTWETSDAKVQFEAEDGDFTLSQDLDGGSGLQPYMRGTYTVQGKTVNIIGTQTYDSYQEEWSDSYNNVIQGNLSEGGELTFSLSGQDYTFTKQP